MMRTHKGFTLIELMLVIALIAILAGIGIPAFRNMTLNNRIVTTTNSMLATLQLARSEAAFQHRQITVCPSNDQTTCTANTQWDEGAVVLQGANLLRLLPQAANHVEVQSASDLVVFDTSGQLTPLAAITLSVADARGIGASSRTVCINLLGQASIVRGDQACP